MFLQLSDLKREIFTAKAKGMLRVPFFHRSKIISDEGFIVSFVNRSQLRYTEGDSVFLVGVEGAGRYIDIFHSSIRRSEPDACEPIDSQTDQRVTENVTRALEWRGLTVRVVT